MATIESVTIRAPRFRNIRVMLIVSSPAPE
jgi:hypothetical protein